MTDNKQRIHTSETATVRYKFRCSLMIQGDSWTANENKYKNVERISETTSWRMSKCVICHSVFKAICYSGSVLVVALLVYLNSCSCPVVKIRHFLRMNREFQWPHMLFSLEWRINSCRRNAACSFKIKKNI